VIDSFTKTNLKKITYTALFFVFIIWIVELVNLFMNHNLVIFGIYPRKLDGLIGILISPIIHGSITHTISNTLPLFFLSGFMVLIQKNRFMLVNFLIVICSGVLIWLFARNSYHVGSSGLIFGYFGAIIMHAYIKRNFLSIFILILILLSYGSTILFGLLPLNQFISYESHLFGLISGLVVVYFMEKYTHPSAV
jgi:membrane associated rhomboid family serine protease